MTSSTDDKFRQAVLALQAGRVDAAERLFKQVLQVQPRHVAALNLLSVLCTRLGRFEEAERYARLALKENASSDATLYNYGLILKALKRPAEALERFSQALEINASVAETWNNRGTVFNELKRYSEAIGDFDRAIALNARYPEAFSNKGRSLAELRMYREALAACDRALELKPDLVEAWIGRGNVLTLVGQHNDAFTAYDRALALKPDMAGAWLGRGNVFSALRQYDDALAAYDRALALKPDLAEAWLGRGNVLPRLKRHEEAAAAFAMLLKIDPQQPFAKGLLLHQRMLLCDWSGFEKSVAEIERDLACGKPAASPFGWQGVATSPRSLQWCATLFNARRYPPNLPSSCGKWTARHDKIRIGYSSGEFRDHATSHLIVGVLENHDKARFEIYGVDNGADDQSLYRRRIRAAVHDMIDISTLNDDLAVAAIRKNEIDILVNLNGYFGDDRMGVFAQRAAPIQVNYLGFPGTLGASSIDYIIADRQVIPPDHTAFYNERIVYLPDCYQANDRQKEISARVLTRAECGLPQRGFVFCCFNNPYKINPDMFGRWMSILKQVDESVLWLLEDSPTAATNLRRQAAKRGINSERLVFAKRMPLPDHLARHRSADLFLDTLPYNAHTTGSDALWAGLPVLTQIGGTFPGRVAASLLQAIGLPELITPTAEAYEEMAIELARDPEKLARIKRKLANNRLTTSLFDTALFTRRIEAAYAAMYDRYRSGLPPDHIHVSP